MSTLTEITSTNWSLSLETQGQVVQGADDIRQCINIILYTIPGSLPLQPEFGCDLHQYIDEPVTNRSKIAKAIFDAIELFEPRVVVTSVTSVLVGAERIDFSINYKILNTVDTGQPAITYGINL